MRTSWIARSEKRTSCLEFNDKLDERRFCTSCEALNYTKLFSAFFIRFYRQCASVYRGVRRRRMFVDREPRAVVVYTFGYLSKLNFFSIGTFWSRNYVRNVCSFQQLRHPTSVISGFFPVDDKRKNTFSFARPFDCRSLCVIGFCKRTKIPFLHLSNFN